jgi:hypothetical protein
VVEVKVHHEVTANCDQGLHTKRPSSEETRETEPPRKPLGKRAPKVSEFERCPKILRHCPSRIP